MKTENKSTTAKQILLIGILLLFGVNHLQAANNRDLILDNNRGVAQMGQFEYAKAREIFFRLTKTHPKNLVLKINLAIATLNRQEKGDEKRALAILKRVLDKDKNNLHALYCSGLLELYLGNPKIALDYFIQVSSQDPRDPEVLYFIGKTQLQLKRYREAIRSFEKTIRINQYVSSAYYGIIMAYRQLGEREIAIKKIKAFQKIKSNPRVRPLEFKYTKMGKKAEVQLIGNDPASSIQKPAGSPFKRLRAVRISDAEKIKWQPTNPNSGDAKISISMADIDGDGHTDIFIAGAVRTKKNNHNAVLIKDPNSDSYRYKADHPLAKIDRINAVLWGDFNNDLSHDVYFCRNGKNLLWQRNKGPDGQWVDMTESYEVANKQYNTVEGLIFDADHDGDLDIFLVNLDGPNELLNNDRNGKFRSLATRQGLAGQTIASKGILAADLDNDRDSDILILNEHAPNDLYINDRLWKYHRSDRIPSLLTADIQAAVSGDLDSNGQVEIYTLNSKGRIRVWEMSRDGIWQDIKLKGIESSNPGQPYRLAISDINGDGRLELMANSGEKRIVAYHRENGNLRKIWASESVRDHAVLKNWTLLNSLKGPLILTYGQKGPLAWHPNTGRYRFAMIQLSGTRKDQHSWRSNASGIGTRLAVRVGSAWTVYDSFKQTSSPGQSLQPICVGTGGQEQLDFIAIDWSDGVYQTELSLAGGKQHHIFEKQRQLSSCPVLFAWNGREMTFVSDLLGVGGIGYAVAPGEYAPPRPWENFLFPKKALQAKDGQYHIILCEPMEEAAYMDSIKLLAYDLPEGWSMTLDERMGITAPFPTGKPIYYRDKIIPVSAINDRGENVITSIRTRDLKAADPGALDHRFIGLLKKEHVLTVIFENALDHYDGQPVLVADGWVEYPYSQTNFAAWQAGRTYQAPTIEVEGPDGRWQTLLEQFGYPAGMPRQMALPLKGLPKGCRKIRIRSNQEIYWDRLFIAFSRPCPGVRIHPMPMASAELRQIGFPERIDKPQRLPFYNYSRRAPFWDTRYLEGDYTRFGPVKELINRKDNGLAIFGAGEGLSIRYNMPKDPLTSGYRRFFVLETIGWCKDMDLYTKDNETLGPLPGRQGKTDFAKKIETRYNIRYLSGRE